jgi:hypothetical protein
MPVVPSFDLEQGIGQAGSDRLKNFRGAGSAVGQVTQVQAGVVPSKPPVQGCVPKITPGTGPCG